MKDEDFVDLVCVEDIFKGRYEINKLGQVRIKDSKVILKISYHHDYPRVILRPEGCGRNQKGNKGYFIHVLLANTFLPGKSNEKCEIDHVDRDKNNFSLSNLRWVSRSENKKNRGSMKCHGLLYAKLNDSGQEIERVYAQDCSKVEISGIAKSIKYNIKYKGYYWKRVILDVENYYKRFQDISKEIWSDIIGLESSGWKVSNLGTLKNSKGIIVVGTLNEFGYRFVNIQRKIYKVHRLVAATFITKRPLLETEIIDHIDTNRENNSAANLRVCDGHGENLSNPETRKKHLKSVLQYDLQGNFIKEHASVIEAYLDLGFTLEKASKYSGIISCCRGKYKSSQGYIWRYK